MNINDEGRSNAAYWHERAMKAESRLDEADALLRGIRYNFYMAQHWADRIDAHLARKP